MRRKFVVKTVEVEGCEGKFAPVELIRLGMN